MLFKIAFALLIAWLLGVLGVYRIGDLVHVFFLVGGLFFLLAVAKARDAATGRQRADERSDKS
jgi:hypothetical protein